MALLGSAKFRGARFYERARFGKAQFNGDVDFDAARARPDLDHSWPTGWTTRVAAEGEGEG